MNEHLTSTDAGRRNIADAEDALRVGPVRWVEGERAVGVIVSIAECVQQLESEARGDIGAPTPTGADSS